MSWQQQLKNKRLHAGGASSGSSSSLIPSHHSLAPSSTNEFALPQIDTQKTAFMRWVNFQLAATSYPPMTNIERDLRDGKRLVGLIEVVSGEPLKPERGNMRIHQMANVAKVKAFLEKTTDEPLAMIGNESIVDGNAKLTLGLIWVIIYRFQIQNIANAITELYPSIAEDINNMEGDESIRVKKKGASQQQVDAKQVLLRWVRHQLEDYSDILPTVQDFHKSWKTGVVFAALIHRHDPNFLPEFYTSILESPHETPDQCRSTLTLAFDTALEKMALPRLLDPGDLIDSEIPDERSIMTYVSEYYLVMSKHQKEQDPVVAAELQEQRVQAKEQRITKAEEDRQAQLRRIQEEEERKKREEQEELERIRLRRQEIEGWSMKAIEKAREEEEARRKRREEEEEKDRQRQLRREQREREQAVLLEKIYGKKLNRRLSTADANPMDSGVSESEASHLTPVREPMDPEELKKRQEELDEKLESYLQRTADLFEWLRKKDNSFPEIPDITTPLDRTRDVDPFQLEVEQRLEKMALKAQVVSEVQSAREELLDYESPELSSEQVSEVNNIWNEIDAHWTSLTQKTSLARNAIQEMQWIVECSQEIDRILGDIQRFEEQLQAAAEKRSQDTLQDRSQPTLLDRQDKNLVTIHEALKAFTDILSTLLDSNTYTAPEYLSDQKVSAGSDIVPRLDSSLEESQHNLSNDRLLRTFLNTYDLSEEWVRKSAEWLASVDAPKFVSEDVWAGADTVKEYLSRDKSHDDNLEQFQTEMTELKAKLDEEQVKITEFRTEGLEKLEQDSQAVIKAMEETHDTTAQETTKAVQNMVQDVTGDLEKIEDTLPREQSRCNKALRVLDYLFSMRSVLNQLEAAFTAVDEWIMTQPSDDVEAAVSRVEVGRDQLEMTFKADDVQPVVWDSIQIRHAALSSLVKDLRSTFDEKQEIVKADQQMKELLELAQTCQTTLREFRSKLYGDAPFKGFISEDETPFNEYAALVSSVGQSFDAFENGVYLKYEAMASTLTTLASVLGSRHDPSVIENRIASVSRLLGDIRALRVDRERDIATIVECRRVAGLLKELNSELGSLEAAFAALDITVPEQKSMLNDLMERFSHTVNEIVLLEQGIIYRHITRDPSCTTMLKEIKDRQISINQTQARLQSGLEIGEQWNIIWDQFTDRVATLQRFLSETENTILSRGITTIDALADGDSKWLKTEDELHAAEVANNQTQLNIKEFQKQRMLELSNLKVALYQSIQVSGEVESLDQIRARQYQEAEQQQQKLKEGFQRLHTLNNREAFQLEILGQRLVWSQQQAVSKKEIEGSISACQGIIEKYGRLLEKCGESNDTSDLSAKSADQIMHRMDQIFSTAAAQKESTYDVTVTIYSSLAELAVVAAPGETEPVEKKVPLHLEVELNEFKSRYNILDLHMEYACQVIGNASQMINLVRKIDSMDSGFLRMAKELSAEQEANPITLEKLDAIRDELKDLTEEAQAVAKLPKPADKVADIYSTSEHQPSGATIEKILRVRLDASSKLNNGLDPLLIAFKALLAYQDGLRKLSGELDGHDKWITRSGQKVQSVHDQIKQMFSSWPGDVLEQMKYHQSEAMVVFDVHEQVLVDDLDVLMAEMDKEFAHVQAQKQGFFESKRKIEVALQNSTVHSKQLKTELEWFADSLTRRIQQLEADIRTRTLQLQALEKRAVWEREIEVSRSWFKDFAKAVILFAREQTKWRSNHKEFDDAASMRSVRTTASRLVIDRLGLSVIEFEEQVEIFETESRPRVDKAWSELCSALVFISRSIPEEFQFRQDSLGRDFEEIRKQVLYSAQIVTQRRSLEEVALRLEEIEGYKGEDGSRRLSVNSGWNGADTKTAAKPPKVKKEKGWSRFQAKVKKLTRK